MNTSDALYPPGAIIDHSFMVPSSMTSLSPPASSASGPFSVRIKRLESPRLQIPKLSSLEPFQSSIVHIGAGFGPVYVGDQFRALVHVSAIESVSDVSVSLCMQASMPDVALMKSDTVEDISGGEGRDFLIEYDISSPGLHQIVCSIDYTEIASSLQSVFTRVLKFQAQPPFSFSHYVSNTSTQSFINVEVTNLVQSSVSIRSIQFLLNSSALSPISTDIVVEDQFDKEIILNELECFASTSIINWNRAFSDNCIASPLSGRFQVIWRQLAGSELATSKSTMINLSPAEDIKLAVINAPASAQLETVFRIQLMITNASQVDLDDIRIEFVKDRLSYLRPSGRIVQNIGKLPQRSTLGYTIAVVGLSTGIHSLNGVRLNCLSTGRLYDFDQVCQIEVVS